MNLFDTLFPPRSRAPGGNRQRGSSGRRAVNRLRSLGLAERLERRDLLAAWAGEVKLATTENFFIDPGNFEPGGGSIPNPMTSEYAAYTITNNEAVAKDIWVRAVLTPMGPGETRRVGFGAGFNNEDGIYHVGSVTGGGGKGTAFLYFTDAATATSSDPPDPTDQPYDLEVWDGKPGDGDYLATASFKYDQILVTNQNSSSKINTIIFDPPIPPAGLFVGDTLTLKVGGYLGNAADQALFTPATRSDWQPDTFELRSTAIDVSGTSWMPNQIWNDAVPPDGLKVFNATYNFLVAQPSIPGSGPTIVSPTQFIGNITPSGEKWDHHAPDEETLPLIPEAKYKLEVTKTDGGSITYTPGLPVTYTMTLSNTGTIAVDDIVISDQMQGSVIDWATSSIASVIYVNAGPSDPTTPIQYDPSTGFLGGTVDVGVGGSVTIVFTAQTYPSATAVLENKVEAQPPKGDPLFGYDRNDPLPIVQLGITKEPVLRTVVAGELDGGVLKEYTYTITVTNGGPSNAHDVEVLDTWPTPAGSIVQVAIDNGGVGTIDQPVPGGDFTWKIPSLAPGLAILTVTYTVPASTPPQDYYNTASVKSKEVPTPIEVTATTRVTVDVLLDITKGPPIQPADSGDGITYSYTITVTNGGVSNAPNVKVEDFWPTPVGSIVQGSVALGPGPAIGVITPVGSNGDFNWIIDSLPPGVWKLTAAYTVPASTLTGDYINNVQLTADGLASPLTASATTVVTQPTPTSDTPALILGTDDGCNVLGIVRVIDPRTGDEIAPSFEPYPGFKGSVRVTSGDVNGDGVSDIVVAPGRGRPGLVRVYNTAGQPLDGGKYDFYPFGSGWRGGVEVAVGNVDGVIGNEIVAATSTGKPLVNVFQVVVGTGVNPNAIRSFRPFPKPYSSGVMLTVGDYGTYNGSWSGVPDGRAEIAVGTYAGVPAQVRIFNAQPTTPVLLRSFLPFGSKFRQGVTLSSARFSSAVIEDVFVGTGVGGKSQLKYFDGSGTQTGGTNVFASFFSKSNAILFSAALDLSGANGKVDNIYGAQGRGGINGLPSGVGRFTGTPPATPLGSWKAPLRIAPILIGPPTRAGR